MNLSGTKALCVLFTLIALSMSAASLVFMGISWAKYLLITCIFSAVAIGLPFAALAMLKKIDDDRGRRGVYNFLNEDETKTSDRLNGLYHICTTVLIVAALLMWIGFFFSFVLQPAEEAIYATSDLGVPLSRADVAGTSLFFSNLCIVSSLMVAYLQRGKGAYLSAASVSSGVAFFLLSLASLCIRS